MKGQIFDVAIIGGGAAGSAAALTLTRTKGCSVCIIENSDFTEPRVGETIPPDANRLLFELGVDHAFKAQGHLPCYGSHSLWGGTHLGHNDFLTSPYGHGWHLDRCRFDQMLLDQAIASGAALIREECKQIHSSDDHVDSVETENYSVKAQHYIDATGRCAKLLRSFKLAHQFDDRQAVIWARFKMTDQSLGKSTWLEAVQNGWWYAAQIPGGEAVVALGTDPRLAKASGIYHVAKWVATLTETHLIAPKLARAKFYPESFRITSSHSYIAERSAGKNWLAVGDAASAYDPLSSAGIYKALLTGQLAAHATQSGCYEAYRKGVHEDYNIYLAKRQELYCAETRWPDSVFWSVRQKPLGLKPLDPSTYDSVAPKTKRTQTQKYGKIRTKHKHALGK